MSQINLRGRLKCSCCTHPHAAEIDVGLSRGVALGVLAMCFGVSPDSLQHHWQNHFQQTTETD
jgi:hypothetical protein